MIKKPISKHVIIICYTESNLQRKKKGKRLFYKKKMSKEKEKYLIFVYFFWA